MVRFSDLITAVNEANQEFADGGVTFRFGIDGYSGELYESGSLSESSAPIEVEVASGSDGEEGYYADVKSDYWKNAVWHNNVKKVDESLTTSDEALNIFLKAAADRKSDLHKALQDAETRQTESGKWETGVVAVIDVANNKVVDFGVVPGRGSNNHVSLADVQSMTTKLNPNNNYKTVFYHDHTETGGPMSNDDIRVGHGNDTITIAKHGSNVNIMTPYGFQKGTQNPLLNYYTVPTSILGL